MNLETQNAALRAALTAARTCVKDCSHGDHSALLTQIDNALGRPSCHVCKDTGLAPPDGSYCSRCNGAGRIRKR